MLPKDYKPTRYRRRHEKKDSPEVKARILQARKDRIAELDNLTLTAQLMGDPPPSRAAGRNHGYSRNIEEDDDQSEE